MRMNHSDAVTVYKSEMSLNNLPHLLRHEEISLEEATHSASYVVSWEKFTLLSSELLYVYIRVQSRGGIIGYI